MFSAATILMGPACTADSAMATLMSVAKTCRQVYDVPGCPGDLRRLAPRGFTVEHHDVTLCGRCRDRARRETRSPR
jgi:hypothetical protein